MFGLSHRENGDLVTKLLRANAKQVSAVGSAPYVEQTREEQLLNMDVFMELARTFELHADFHLDYNLDNVPQELDPKSGETPLILKLIEKVREARWEAVNPGKVVTVGHATRLTRFSGQQMQELKSRIGDLPIFLVGLPQSDLYMMGRGDSVRGTINPIRLRRNHDLPVAISVNNVGNAFTPQGTVDPLGLCVLGVATYQDGTMNGCRSLLVSLPLSLSLAVS